MSTIIANCSYSHEGQDSLHGKGRRVKNSTEKKPAVTYRCTVCGEEQVH